MLTLFYFLVVEQIVQGLVNLWDGFRWLKRAQRRMESHPGFYSPRVALICPLKGAEPGLEQNIAALVRFDYPDYEVFLVFASAEDSARKVAERIASWSKRKIHIVIAGSPDDCGEKVNNLRTGILQAGTGFDAYVFADSDGRPGRHWLTRLVGPLANANLGAVTTFRWYFQQRPGFWSALASAWNAPAATYLGDHAHNFCWGGGTAIRREQFERADVLGHWSGSVSDDLSLTRALHRAGMPILFAPECLVPCELDCDAGELIEFTNRQIIITKVYERRLWALAALGHLLYCGAVMIGLGLFLFNLFSGKTAIPILLLTLIPPILSMARGVLRLAAVMELLPDWKTKLLADSWIWTVLATLAPFLSLWNSVTALFTRRIKWRGIRYELITPGQTRILGR